MKLIDKDKIVLEIERRKKELIGLNNDFANQWACASLDNILSFIDTLEAKETNLEKELETLDSLLYDLDGVAVKGTTSYLTVEDVKDIAKSFFELGLKAQKGEKSYDTKRKRFSNEN